MEPNFSVSVRFGLASVLGFFGSVFGFRFFMPRARKLEEEAAADATVAGGCVCVWRGGGMCWAAGDCWVRG